MKFIGTLEFLHIEFVKYSSGEPEHCEFRLAPRNRPQRQLVHCSNDAVSRSLVPDTDDLEVQI